ncbi:MAG: glycosyltransferase family 2 protein [Pseudomonadota bacterium]|nr:glycosyltransferase family 2 protein [Pseudomonadota bacterium]
MNKEQSPFISVVVPVYNEEKNIRPFIARTVPILEKIGTYEIIFGLDPSSDDTERVLEEAAEQNSCVRYIRFSRRIGQPSAVLAGILNCGGKTCVAIDVDLQDPPEIIADLYKKYLAGADVVYAKRRSRAGETAVKRFVSYLGYKLINTTAEVEIPRDTGDFRIINRRVIEELRRLPENHGFLRGLVALVGFRQEFVEYDRDPRVHGKGNYNRYFGSLTIGFNGLVGFSSFLLSFVLLFGFVVAGIAFLGALAIFTSWLFSIDDYPIGYPSIIILILFLGGVQMISIGILGEYIGRIYDEVKGRPRFIIDKTKNISSIIDNGDRR